MRIKDKRNNVKKVNLLMEMRGKLINETLPYYSEMGGYNPI